MAFVRSVDCGQTARDEKPAGHAGASLAARVMRRLFSMKSGIATLVTTAMPIKKPATYEDILSLPQGMVGEIVQGELIVAPRPAVGHALASSVLGRALGGPFHGGHGGPGGWWILDEVELHLGPDVLVPDLSGWRRTRMIKLPGPTEGFISLPPDWVCEVISPSSAQLDRGRKLQVYARERVSHIWLVDPLARTLEVFRLEENGWLLVRTFAERERARAEPFDAIELDIGELWSSSQEDQQP